MRRTLVIFATALMLSGCAAYSAVEPKPVTLADSFVVDPQIRWSQISQGPWDTWTVDGPGLQALQFLKGLGHDEPLFTRGSDKRPRFRKDMTPSDVVEFVVDSLNEAGAQQPQASGLRPVKFGGHDGFRFEVALATKEGLEKRAFVVGSIVKEKLYLIMYSGAADHYYGKHLPEADRVVQSLRPK